MPFCPWWMDHTVQRTGELDIFYCPSCRRSFEAKGFRP